MPETESTNTQQQYQIPTDPFAPGSLGWRLPWALTGQGDYITPDSALEIFLEWCEARNIELWEHQEDALVSLACENHVILGTPTGSGKSLVAAGLCFMGLACGGQTYYTAPIKALVSEKFFQMVDYFGRENVGMITGDTSINAQAPIICCTAEILANAALREGANSNISRVVMDEFHFFADFDRGWAWQAPLITLENTQFLLMSATLGDTSQIEESLRANTGRSVDNITNAKRPVPLTYNYSLESLEATVELAIRNNEAPLYIVHFSQDSALSSAQALASFGVTTKQQREAIKRACKNTKFTTAFGKILLRLLGCGIGVHHAGMLPRYRLLVEKLAQAGLLPVICGTDTLGVGINVPIHTVVLTQLTKFDGNKMRRLRAREFHQIAGRAGRSGFDTEGVVTALAPEHEIENHKALIKAGGDPKKLKRIHKKQPPEGFVGWSENTFNSLIAKEPEKLAPRMKITHSIVLNVISRGGNARKNIAGIIEKSLQSPEEKLQLNARADEIFQTLIEAGVVEFTPASNTTTDDTYSLTVDLPDDFSLDQPLSPFLLAALDMLDPQSDTYAFDVISIAEATLENPRQLLRAQEKKAKEAAVAEMKMQGIEYDERMERLENVTYPKPLEDLLSNAFEIYAEGVPWARDYSLEPKSVLRDMLETASDFKTYIQRYNIAKSEGTLLRYLSDAWRVLDRTLPQSAITDQLADIISWLGFLVRTTDSSLIDEWSGVNSAEEETAGAFDTGQVVKDRRALTVLVRNAMFQRVRLASQNNIESLGRLDTEWGFGQVKWQAALDDYFEEHESIQIDADARSAKFFAIDDSLEKSSHTWHVQQIFSDEEASHDFSIMATVNLDETHETGSVVFASFNVGYTQDLLQQQA